MSAAVPLSEPRVSPELRATIFYFVQYMAGAVVSVYGGIWFASTPSRCW